ncbi:MAG: heparan-alpha-glucosaminide N-acetyltransferase domain-containing protein [Cyclobacteriaceae bacterium]
MILATFPLMIVVSRNLSIDVLRGLTIALMIVVNTPGNFSSTYSPFLHADWHGFTLTDWVFPTFLFVMGNAMSFGFAKMEALGERAFLLKVMKRFLIIFLIGYFMFWFPFVKYNAEGDLITKTFATTRIFGVLQRIALAYLLASLIIHYTKVSGALLISLLVLVGYRLILLAFGNLSLEGNAILKLDQWILGEQHMFHGEGIAFDPEGILSTLPAVVNVIAGYCAAIFIIRRGFSYQTIAHLMVIGCVLIFMGLWWDLFFPINKKLWTSSYVIYTVGIDLMVLSVLIYIIDLQKVAAWTYPFEVLGKNPLFIYVLSMVGVILLFFFRVEDQRLYHWIYQHWYQPMFGDYLGSFMFALSALAVCWGVAYLMDLKKIYIRI